MSHNRSEFTGNIITVRAVEDSIRATKKYKEYLGRRSHHPLQGEAFSSEFFCKHYEIYPEMEVSLDMSIIDAIFWLGRGTPCIDVLFKYDYRENKASVIVKDGAVAVRELSRGIPGFSDTLAKVVVNGRGE